MANLILCVVLVVALAIVYFLVMGLYSVIEEAMDDGVEKSGRYDGKL
jgi:uncharacterized protein YneF (UPF0154 family)